MNMDWGNESQSGAPVTVFPPTAGVTVDGTVSGGIVSDGSRTIHFTAHDPQGLLQSVTTYSWNQTYGYTIEYGSSYPVSGTNADVPRVQWLTPGNWYFWTNATSSSGLNGVGPGTNAAGFLVQVIGNGSAFVSQTVPAAVYVGQTFSVSQTWTNTGTTTWLSP
jgi:hypothetical protein